MALRETKGSVTQPARHPTIYESPIRLLIVIVLSAFVSEALVMIALRFIFLPPWWEVIFDASLLVILISPVLYLFLFRPLILHIGDRRRAEEETRRALAELEQIFDTAADGMRLVDKDFNVLQVNETFAGMAGVEKDKRLSISISRYLARLTDTGWSLWREKRLFWAGARPSSW
ncbi:MAG: PAS domain-containing protein [Deltaproteobacteria bacterium]|nr:PAS domain-containing protein [Deltaproteobacteria bacterium]